MSTRGGGHRFPVFAARLRQAREQCGLLQGDCARRCGVSIQVWSNWEHGWRVPGTARETRDIADLLRADPAWLLGMTDVRRPWPPDPAQGVDEPGPP